jgi:hypothetical protein
MFIVFTNFLNIIILNTILVVLTRIFPHFDTIQHVLKLNVSNKHPPPLVESMALMNQEFPHSSMLITFNSHTHSSPTVPKFVVMLRLHKLITLA